MKTLNQLAKRAKSQHRAIEPVVMSDIHEDVYRDCLVYEFQKRKEKAHREVQVPLFVEMDLPDYNG